MLKGDTGWAGLSRTRRRLLPRGVKCLRTGLPGMAVLLPNSDSIVPPGVVRM
jgi:hypothetical protein